MYSGALSSFYIALRCSGKLDNSFSVARRGLNLLTSPIRTVKQQRRLCTWENKTEFLSVLWLSSSIQCAMALWFVSIHPSEATVSACVVLFWESLFSGWLVDFCLILVLHTYVTNIFFLVSGTNVYFFYNVNNKNQYFATWFKKAFSFLCKLRHAAGWSLMQRAAGYNSTCCSLPFCINLRFSAASMQETGSLCQN